MTTLPLNGVRLPEFQALLDAITRNDGVFQPPLVTADFRVLDAWRRSGNFRPPTPRTRSGGQ